MPSWQQEMGWYCGTCEKLNRGRFKECQACGKPKRGEPFVDLPGEGEGVEWAVKDTALIEQATAGSDWECRFCSSHQRRDNGDCAQCGAKQGESRQNTTKWDDGTTGPAGEGPTVLEELQQESKAVDAEIKEVRQKNRQPTQRRRPTPQKRVQPIEPPAEEEWHPPPWWNRERKITGWVLLGATLIGLLFFFLFRTRIIEATVTSTQWAYSVHVERHQIESKSGFDEDRPSDAFDVSNEGTRHHHYRKVKTGTRQVSYEERYQCGETCSTTPRHCTKTPVRCTSNNNGFKSCSGGDERCTGGDRKCSPKHCTRTKHRTEDVYEDESVREMYYSWKVWRWVPNRTVRSSGTTDEPHWPSDEEIGLNLRLPVDAKEERKRHETSFSVTFTDDEQGTHAYTPKSLEEFKQLPVGTKRRVEVSIAGSPKLLP